MQQPGAAAGAAEVVDDALARRAAIEAEITFDSAGANDLALVMRFRGKLYRRCPQSSKGLDAATLDILQAVWDAKDKTPDRALIRKDRETTRRVAQRRADPEQARRDAGARPTCNYAAPK